MSLTVDLKVWRKDRNITNADTKVYVENVIEELLEIYHPNKEDIKQMQGAIMQVFFNAEPISEDNTIDAIQDIQVFSVNETELMGYNNEMCNYEVFKEINSRKQDSEQMTEWKANGAKGKWLKDTNQSEVTKYKADYERCKDK